MRLEGVRVGSCMTIEEENRRMMWIERDERPKTPRFYYRWNAEWAFLYQETFVMIICYNSM